MNTAKQPAEPSGLELDTDEKVFAYGVDGRDWVGAGRMAPYATGRSAAQVAEDLRNRRAV